MYCTMCGYVCGGLTLYCFPGSPGSLLQHVFLGFLLALHLAPALLIQWRGEFLSNKSSRQVSQRKGYKGASPTRGEGTCLSRPQANLVSEALGALTLTLGSAGCIYLH